MHKGFRIGRVFGINIRIDWSWPLIFLLILWNLGTTFGGIHRDWGFVQQWGLALVAALLFFISVLAHELAHSLVAKAQGVPVRSITLHLFGGVSNIQEEPSSPQGEFVMAIVGPITSLVVGGALAWLGLLGGGLSGATTDPLNVLGGLGPWNTLVLWLGSTNVMLGLFNLIPGFPLDGGRVVRSILWAVTDDLRRATRWASWAGQGIGWLMIVAGIAVTFGLRIPLVGSGIGSGLWLAFIGWFLNGASVRSYRMIVIQDILDDVPVETVMRRDPPTCIVECSVRRLVNDFIMKTDDQSFPIIKDGARQLAGIVTLDDVRGVPRDEWDTKMVGDIMTPVEDLVVVGPDDDVADALNKLMRRDVRQLPVVSDGQLLGVLRRRDIVKWLQVHSELSGVGA